MYSIPAIHSASPFPCGGDLAISTRPTSGRWQVLPRGAMSPVSSSQHRFHRCRGRPGGACRLIGRRTQRPLDHHRQMDRATAGCILVRRKGLVNRGSYCSCPPLNAPDDPSGRDAAPHEDRNRAPVAEAMADNPWAPPGLGLTPSAPVPRLGVCRVWGRWPHPYHHLTAKRGPEAHQPEAGKRGAAFRESIGRVRHFLVFCPRPPRTRVARQT